MLTLSDVVVPDTPEWDHFYENLQNSTTLASFVLTAWQIGLWFAKTLVEQQLNQRAQRPQNWKNCSQCGSRLQSKVPKIQAVRVSNWFWNGRECL